MIGTVVLPIVVIVVLVLVNGVFVAAEFALVGAQRTRLHTLAEGGSRAARWLVELIDRPTGKDGYIAIAQLGITLASIGLGMYGEPAVAGWLYGPLEDRGLSYAAAHSVGFVIALSGITYMHVVFGEMIPKALALQAPERVIIKVNPVMRAFGLVFRPMVAVLNRTALGLMRLLRIPEPDKSMALHTSAELAIVTDEAADSGQLGALQRDLIRNIFELDERRAEELMTPRGRVETLDRSVSLDEVAARIAASPRSRYPVVDGDLDHVLGVLHIKDLIRAAQGDRPARVEDLVRPLPTVPATMGAEQLLARFKRDKVHAALVTDEFGSTVGFVTLDDVIAEVMDDDVGRSDTGAVTHDDGSITFDGEGNLVDINADHGLALGHPDVATIAGLVLARLGAVPSVGDRVAVAPGASGAPASADGAALGEPGTAPQEGEVVLEVEAMDGVKITRVRLYRPPSPSPD